MRRFTIVATALLLVLSLGCRKKQSTAGGSTTDTAQTAATVAPAPEPVDTTPADFTFERRQEFSQSIQQQLASLDQQIRDLAAQAKSQGGAVSDRAIANVRASRRAVDRSLRQVDAATAANWDRAKQGVRTALDNLSEAMEAAQPK
jgi:hypothetical protein